MIPLRVAPPPRLQFVFLAVLIFASSVTPLFSGSASAAPLTLPAPEEKVLRRRQKQSSRRLSSSRTLCTEVYQL